MHINRVILMGQVTDDVALSDTFAVFGLRVGDMKFPVYVFDPLARRELANALGPGMTVQVDGCLAFDAEVQGGRLYVAVTSDRACQVRLADRSVFAAGGPPSLAGDAASGHDGTRGRDAATPGPEAGPKQQGTEATAGPKGRVPVEEPVKAPSAKAPEPARDAPEAMRPAGPRRMGPSTGNGAAHEPPAREDSAVRHAEPEATRQATPAANGSTPPTPAGTPAPQAGRPGRPRMGGMASLPPPTPDPAPAEPAETPEDDDPIPF